MYISLSALLAPVVMLLCFVSLSLFLVLISLLHGSVHVELLTLASPPANGVGLHLDAGPDSSSARTVRGEDLRRSEQPTRERWVAWLRRKEDC